jgi:hypothetical protein
VLFTCFECLNEVSDVLVLCQTDTVEVIISVRRSSANHKSNRIPPGCGPITEVLPLTYDVKFSLKNIDKLEIYDKTAKILNPQITALDVKIKWPHKTCITTKKLYLQHTK